MAVTKAITAWLVFCARDQSLRVVKRLPQLDWDEMAWKITLTVPVTWGQVRGAITITLPEEGPEIPPTVELLEA